MASKSNPLNWPMQLQQTTNALNPYPANLLQQYYPQIPQWKNV